MNFEQETKMDFAEVMEIMRKADGKLPTGWLSPI